MISVQNHRIQEVIIEETLSVSDTVEKSEETELKQA